MNFKKYPLVFLALSLLAVGCAEDEKKSMLNNGEVNTPTTGTSTAWSIQEPSIFYHQGEVKISSFVSLKQRDLDVSDFIKFHRDSLDQNLQLNIRTTCESYSSEEFELPLQEKLSFVQILPDQALLQSRSMDEKLMCQFAFVVKHPLGSRHSFLISDVGLSVPVALTNSSELEIEKGAIYKDANGDDIVSYFWGDLDLKNYNELHRYKLICDTFSQYLISRSGFSRSEENSGFTDSKTKKNQIENCLVLVMSDTNELVNISPPFYLKEESPNLEFVFTAADLSQEIQVEQLVYGPTITLLNRSEKDILLYVPAPPQLNVTQFQYVLSTNHRLEVVEIAGSVPSFRPFGQYVLDGKPLTGTSSGMSFVVPAFGQKDLQIRLEITTPKCPKMPFHDTGINRAQFYFPHYADLMILDSTNLENFGNSAQPIASEIMRKMRIDIPADIKFFEIKGRQIGQAAFVYPEKNKCNL